MSNSIGELAHKIVFILNKDLSEDQTEEILSDCLDIDLKRLSDQLKERLNKKEYFEEEDYLQDEYNSMIKMIDPMIINLAEELDIDNRKALSVLVIEYLIMEMVSKGYYTRPALYAYDMGF